MSSYISRSEAERRMGFAFSDYISSIRGLLVKTNICPDVENLILSFMTKNDGPSSSHEVFSWSEAGKSDYGAIELVLFRIGSCFFKEIGYNNTISSFGQLGMTNGMSKNEKKKLRKKIRSFFDEFSKLNLDGVEKKMRELKTCNNPVVANILLALLDIKECPFDFRVDETGKNVTLEERYEVEEWLLEGSILTNQTKEDFLSEVVHVMRVETLEAFDKLFPNI